MSWQAKDSKNKYNGPRNELALLRQQESNQVSKKGVR